MAFTNNLLSPSAEKFRENSADSVVFHSLGHTPTSPATVTVTRTLPKPRKGNNGTMKVLVNARRTVDITAPGDAGTRPVPVIVKLETSMPVGADITDLTHVLVDIMRFAAPVPQTEGDRQKLFQYGLLPDGSGTAIPDPT